MTGTGRPHAGSEHLIVLPERKAADALAEELREEGFEHVRVVAETSRTTEGRERDQWAVYVLDTRLPDTSGGGAYEGLRDRFVDVARQHGGSYDQPGDARPPTD